MNLKLNTRVSLILIVICRVAWYVKDYWLGYDGESTVPLFLELPIILIALTAFFNLLVIWLISLLRRKEQLWTTGMTVGLLILMGLSWVLPAPRDMIIYGLRDRLIRDHSFDDLRSFAKDFDQIHRTEVANFWSTKSLMKENLIDTGLKAKYPFLSWVKEDNRDGPRYVHETDGVVNVRWGNRSIGTWGFSVAINGGKLDLPKEAGIKALRLSDDIIVVSEPD